jgi:DNA-binding response OmpR family regulator
MAKRVLCIEDERFIGELYTRALEQAGYSVKVVNDGVEGLQEALQGEYDVILLDIMLPSMNGIDLLHRIKDTKVVPAVTSKIVITTNLEQKEEVRKDIEQLVDGYLIKAEITPKELVAYLSTLLSQY